MIQYFSPKWYFSRHIGLNLQHQTNMMFDEFIQNDSNFHTPQNWSCNIKSSLDVKTDLWKNWFSLLTPVWSDFISSTGTSNELSLLLKGAWINKYSPGSFQEAHDHTIDNINLVAVYFHTLNPDDGSEFRFYNPETHPERISGTAQLLGVNNDTIVCPNVVSGDIIIFPSHYIHMVSQHTGTQERITFSINMQVTPKV